MFIRNQSTPIQKDKIHFLVHSFNIIAIVALLGFCSSLVHADSSTSSVSVKSSVKPAFKYQEIKSIVKKLSKQSTPELLEELVEKSTDFITTFPKYKRVDEVYYRLGYALVELERVEEGIKVFETFIKTHPEARWVAPGLYELGLTYDKLSQHDKADEAYKKLIDHPKFGSQSYAKLAKRVLEQDKASRKGRSPESAGVRSAPSEWIGKPAPDFQVMDLKGKKLSLKKFEGQVVLLDFWATWCPPCVAEIPNVKKAYEKYKDQKFQIIGISLDRSQPPLDAFIERENLAWLHYWDQNGKLANQYGVRGIPSTFLIDGEGVIRRTNLRGSRLETAVAALVKENLTKPAGTKTPGEGSQSIPATKILKQDNTSEKDILSEPSRERLNPTDWVGKPAPDFQVMDLKGKELTLKNYRGQVVLLDFWATWCPPCIAKMPKVKKTYEKFKDQKFQVIGISLDRSQPPLDAYVEKEELAWIHHWDRSRKVRNLYGVRAIPTAFLIDGEGVIRKASLGGFDVETAVAELVKENLNKPADSPLIETPTDSPETGQNVDPKAKEIIDAAVAAHGGLEKLAAVKNIVIESKSFEHLPDGNVQDEGRNKVYYYANKLRNNWYTDDETNSLIFDGNTLFLLEDREVQPIPQERVESFVSFFKDSLFREPIWLLTKLSQNKIPVKYMGIEDVKGVPASVLLVTQPSGKKLKIFISKETHYVVQFNYSFEMGRETENAETLFEDYRDVYGIKIAHHRTTKTSEHRETVITKISFNAEIDEALFIPEGSNE